MTQRSANDDKQPSIRLHSVAMTEARHPRLERIGPGPGRHGGVHLKFVAELSLIWHDQGVLSLTR